MKGEPGPGPRDLLDALGDEDRDLALQLLLSSGSLKELARRYGVSYPTIRARLDKAIARVEALQQGRPPDPMADRLADLVERGQMTPGAARDALRLHRKILQDQARR